MARVKINDDWFKELANPKKEDYMRHLAQIGGVDEPTLEESIAGISKTLNDRDIDSIRKSRPNQTDRKCSKSDPREIPR